MNFGGTVASSESLSLSSQPAVSRLTRAHDSVATGALKRFMDVAIAFVGIVVLSPILLAIALVLKCTGHAPVLFRQDRVGRNARIFKVLKFRTMHPVSSRLGTVTVKDDPRVTRIGSALRACKLDELPQLWNVLTGEMSLVGPRPDVPGYADKLEGESRKILGLRPGITGPATLYYRNEEELLAAAPEPTEYNDTVIYPKKVQLNLQYLEEWSPWRDLAFILVTPLPFLDRWLNVVPQDAALRQPTSQPEPSLLPEWFYAVPDPVNQSRLEPE